MELDNQGFPTQISIQCVSDVIPILPSVHHKSACFHIVPT